MAFICAEQLDFDPRPQLSYVFVEGFYDWVKHFCKDKNKLVKVFAHIFTLKYFYVALEGERITAMTACTQGFAPISLQRDVFTKELGFIRGNFTYFILKRHMVRNSYPFSLGRTTGTIEFVATSPDYRGKGIAGGLITFVMEANPYSAYVLEVADTNVGAVHLYEKLGFKEIRRNKAPKRSGVNFFIYMRKEIEGRA